MAEPEVPLKKKSPEKGITDLLGNRELLEDRRLGDVQEGKDAKKSRQNLLKNNKKGIDRK